MRYPDAHSALRHAYDIQGRSESVRGTLGGLTSPPGGEFTHQEWIAHAGLITGALRIAVNGPRYHAVVSRMTNDPVQADRHISILAAHEPCPSRYFALYAATRWAVNTNVAHDWEHLTSKTSRGQRTLERWLQRACQRFGGWYSAGLQDADNHFYNVGITEAPE